MREITGNLWDYYGKKFYCSYCLAPEGTDHSVTHFKMIGVSGIIETPFVICITTNGTLKKNGSGVMGRGCAAEAKKRIPGIEAELGRRVKEYGNYPVWLEPLRILSFPVKHNWWEKADLQLIKQSAEILCAFADNTNKIFVLPRPGCGNGRLPWEQVRPVIAPILPDNVWVITWAA